MNLVFILLDFDSYKLCGHRHKLSNRKLHFQERQLLDDGSYATRARAYMMALGENLISGV